jgi:hypothetical protein
VAPLRATKFLSCKLTKIVILNISQSSENKDDAPSEDDAVYFGRYVARCLINPLSVLSGRKLEIAGTQKHAVADPRRPRLVLGETRSEFL